MSIRKILILMNFLTVSVLAYYAVKKGLDIVIGIALIISAISTALNIYCEVSDGGRKED